MVASRGRLLCLSTSELESILPVLGAVHTSQDLLVGSVLQELTARPAGCKRQIQPGLPSTDAGLGREVHGECRWALGSDPTSFHDLDVVRKTLASDVLEAEFCLCSGMRTRPFPNVTGAADESHFTSYFWNFCRAVPRRLVLCCAVGILFVWLALEIWAAAVYPFASCYNPDDTSFHVESL